MTVEFVIVLRRNLKGFDVNENETEHFTLPATIAVGAFLSLVCKPSSLRVRRNASSVIFSAENLLQFNMSPVL